MKKQMIALMCLAATAAVCAGCTKDEKKPAEKAATAPVASTAAEAKTTLPKGWTDDFGAAQKTAEKDKKTMLVLFTGSDWCIWCQRLEEQILSKKEFTEEAPKDFVLVFLDFPSDKSKTTPAKMAANRALAEKYGIQGFPTILLMDAKGAVKAQTGFQRLSPAEYVAHLRELAKKDAQ